MKYHFKVHKEGSKFWAKCIELDDCYTQADSMAALNKMMQEALNLYVSEPEDSKEFAAFPDLSIRKSKTIVEVPLDPETAFAFLVRYYRIQHGMTQQQAAKKMGFDSLYSYQRLESRRCNPSLKTISKVKEVFPEFSLDLAVV